VKAFLCYDATVEGENGNGRLEGASVYSCVDAQRCTLKLST